MVTTIILCGIISSCNKEDENPLQGYWYNGIFEEMYLGSDGKGYATYTDILGTHTRDIEWSSTETILVIDRIGWGAKSNFLYKVTSSTLVLTDMNSGKTSSFSR